MVIRYRSCGLFLLLLLLLFHPLLSLQQIQQRLIQPYHQQPPRVGLLFDDLHLGSESVESSPSHQQRIYSRTASSSIPSGFERFLRHPPFSSPSSPQSNGELLGKTQITYHPLPTPPFTTLPPTSDSEIVYEYYEEPDSELSYQYVTKSSEKNSKKATIIISPSVDLEVEDALKLRGRSVHPESSRSNLPLDHPSPSSSSSSSSSPTKRPAILHSFIRPTQPKKEERSSSSSGSSKQSELEDYSYYEEEYELHPPNPKIKTKMTLSVSTQSSSTTVAPLPSEDRPELGVVISVATTKSVSSGLGSQHVTTPPPKVTFSRITGSPIVVASVQTSQSVAVPLDKGNTWIASLPSAPSSFDTPLNTESPEYYEDDETYPDNYPMLLGGVGVDSTSTTPTTPTPSTPPPLHMESIMDKLDRVQSDLVNGLLSSLPLTPKNSSGEMKGEEESEEEVTTQVIESSSTTNSPDQSLLIKFEDNSKFLPPDYKAYLVSTSSTTSTTTRTPITTSDSITAQVKAVSPSLPNIKFQEVNFDSLAALLPKGYKPSSPTSNPDGDAEGKAEGIAEKTKLQTFPSIKFKTVSLSPRLSSGFKIPSSLVTTTPPMPTTSITLESSSSVSPIEVLIPGIKFEDALSLINLLPPNFKLPPQEKSSTITTTTTLNSNAVSSSITTEKSASGSKLVFPTRPGSLKTQTRPTTPEPSKAESPTPPKVTLKTGWPTRKTTEFTGWPTISTEPTTTVSTTSMSPITTQSTTTTPTTTTTVAPPKRSLSSTCELATCRMEATLRIVGGVQWRPEYADKNTDEWKQLESFVKRELDGAYRSSGLAGLYRSIEIEAFNRGSILVDYFLLLNTSERGISSDQVRSLFHGSLLQAQPSEEGMDPLNDGRLRFGRYTIDPRYTDFQVRNGTVETMKSPAADTLIPQWGIAVIVIGLVSFLLVVIFGVTVLVSRHKNAKKTNAVSLTQEMLNEFNKSHNMGVGLDNYAVDDLYNMDDVWNDNRGHVGVERDRTLERKPPKPRSSNGGKGSPSYNIYDSWKTEWNGHYQNGNFYGDSGYAPSRRRSDYDTNF